MSVPTKLYLDVINKVLRDATGADVSNNDSFIPDAFTGDKKYFNLQLVKNTDLDAYTKFESGTTVHVLGDNDYKNAAPYFDIPASVSADYWTAGTGSEYFFNQPAITEKPDKVYINNSLATEETVGSLSAGAWGWDSENSLLYVRLADGSDPDTQADGYVQYRPVATGETEPFIEVDGDTVNAVDSWYDDDTLSYRTPDITAGELTYEVNARRPAFFNRIGSSAKAEIKLQHEFLEPVTAEPFITLEFTFICRNKIRGSQYSLSLSSINFYTKQEINALLISKADRDTDAVSGNIATFDSNGSPVDSGTSLTTVLASLSTKGDWNASTNTPTLPGTASTGDYWIVSVAGTTDLDGITDWQINDWAVKTETGWAKIDNTETGKLKASSGDSSPGYLDSKVDDETIEVSGNQLKVKTIDADNVNVFNLTTEALKAGILDTDLDNVSGSHDTLASALAISTALAKKATVITGDTTVTFEYGMTSAQMQAIIDAVPRNVGGYRLRFQGGDGTHAMTNNLTFDGFYNGSLEIYGNATEFTKSTSKSVFFDFTNAHGIYITNCMLDEIKVYGLKVQTDDDVGVRNPIYINKCITSNLNIAYNYLLGSGLTYDSAGVSILFSTGNIGVASNYADNIKRGFNFFNTPYIRSIDNSSTGTSPLYGLYAYNALVYMESNQPAGSSGNTYDAGGSTFFSAALNNHNNLTNKGNCSHTVIDSHLENTSNPHLTSKSDVGLSDVENTALSTWTGSGNLTTLGTIVTGVWNGTAIAASYIASLTVAKISDFATAVTNHSDVSANTSARLGLRSATTAKTANYTIQASECKGLVFSNSGATGDVTLTLPAAADGLVVTAIVEAAQTVYIDPDGTEQIFGLTDAGGDRISNATIGSTIMLRATANGWYVLSSYGTWTDAN